MMVVYVKVPLTGEGNVHPAVAGKEVQHVVEETDTARALEISFPVDGERDGNIRLARRAAKCGFSHASAS